jgi:N-succinyldiaminopimelate aminotransferase
MPRTDQLVFPSGAPATVFDQVNAMIDRVGRPGLVRLDMGDTCLKPPAEGCPNGLDQQRWPEFNLYTATAGIPDLVDLLISRLAERNGLHVKTRRELQVTCGAIHALFCAFKVLTRPGEEVLVLAPRWPLVSGLVRQTGAVPVDLPFYTKLDDLDEAGIESLLESAISEKTTALYLNTPNNPSGRVLSVSQLDAIGRVARKHGLWVVSDEAYENFIYADIPHVSPASRGIFQANTVSIFTFSKCLAAAGYRVGYAVASEPIIEAMNRVSAQTIYNAPSNNQQLAAQALLSWEDWFPPLKQQYQEFRNLFVSQCKADFRVPDGGFYAFIDLKRSLDKRGVLTPDYGTEALKILEELIRAGVALLPGEAFGSGYEGWLRACFIAEEKPRLLAGINAINEVLG